MGQVPPGTWKLIVYPLIAVIAFSLLFSAIVEPFKSEGIEPDAQSASLMDVPLKIVTGEPFFNLTIDLPASVGDITIPIGTYYYITIFLPQFAEDALVSYFETMKYVPFWLLVPFLAIVILLAGYALIVIAIAIIP